MTCVARRATDEISGVSERYREVEPEGHIRRRPPARCPPKQYVVDQCVLAPDRIYTRNGFVCGWCRSA
jgi:hypothetical protein